MRLSLSRNDIASSGVFLQSNFWARFKALAGWSYIRFDVSFINGEAPSFALSVLERELGAGIRFAYVPHGPDCDIDHELMTDLLSSLALELRPLLSPRCAFIRFDPAWYGTGQDRPVFDAPLVRGSDVQPPDSVVLNVALNDDELLAGMKPKWRYNVRLAEKKGVVVASEGPAALDEFYALYLATAARDKIAIHPKSYYERLFSVGEDLDGPIAPDVRLWVARYDGTALAAIVTVFYDKEATYLYGASSDEHRNLMPAYALQWAAIRAARDSGCTTYDLYGIPPTDDPAHAMSGLYRFKTGFGGEIRHYAGAWDYALKPGVYEVFRAMERARLFWHKTVRKRMRI